MSNVFELEAEAPAPEPSSLAVPLGRKFVETLWPMPFTTEGTTIAGGLIVTDANTSRTMPVELLRDQRGVYGIGVSDLFDFEAVVWSCGIEPEPYTFERPPRALILRPDWFTDTKPHRRCAAEDRWRISARALHAHTRGAAPAIHPSRGAQSRRTAVATATWKSSGCAQWWSADKKQQARNRGIYHGLRLLSLHVVNHLIGAALEEAADADAVKAARRFTFEHRESIYRAAALSRRALQLTETFPVLALAIYSEHWRLPPLGDFQNWDAEIYARKNCATDLVGCGMWPRQWWR